MSKQKKSRNRLTHEKIMKELRSMTPEERVQTLVDTGIVVKKTSNTEENPDPFSKSEKAKAHARAHARLDAMTPDELAQTLVTSGILTEQFELTEPYTTRPILSYRYPNGYPDEQDDEQDGRKISSQNLAPQTSGLENFYGTWPGDETDEEMLEMAMDSKGKTLCGSCNEYKIDDMATCNGKLFCAKCMEHEVAILSCRIHSLMEEIHYLRNKD